MRFGRAIPAIVAVTAFACLVGRTTHPVDAKDRNASFAAQANPSAIATIQTRVPLTIVDITVTDATGNPVHGLKQSDFTILEDGKQMRPNSFEEHRSDEARPIPTPIKLDLPPNIFTNISPTPPNPGPIDILLFDPLNISAGDQRIIRTRMLDFVDHIPPGTRVAVFNLYATLSILQGFTTDHTLLKAAIEEKKKSATLSPLEDPWQDPINQDPALGIEKRDRTVNKEGEAAAYRAQYELSGLNQIARYLSGIAGRKNLIWFSGSFPLQFPPFPDDIAFPPPPGVLIRPQSYDFEAQMKAATDLLARAHVAVYPIDGRGLEVLPIGNSFEARNRQFVNVGEHSTMEAVAEQTGGKAFYNTNGFTQAAEQAVENGSNYYTITYAPTNQALDTRFRTITVKVDRPAVHLDYRNGYYAVDPGISLSGVKVPRRTAFQAALLHGAPDLTEIVFNVSVTRSPGTENTLLDDNQRDSSEMKPPYRRYSLTYTTHIDNISFTRAADGNYLADFEFEVIVFGADTGNVLNSTNREVRPIVTASAYQSMLKDGAVAHQEIDVPAKGDYFLRIAVHDLATDRVGALEIPTASIHPNPPPALASIPNP